MADAGTLQELHGLSGMISSRGSHVSQSGLIVYHNMVEIGECLVQNGLRLCHDAADVRGWGIFETPSAFGETFAVAPANSFRWPSLSCLSLKRSYMHLHQGTAAMLHVI